MGQPWRFLRANSLASLNALAAICTIILAFVIWFGVKKETESIILAAFMCLALVGTWVLLIVEEFKYSRKARYAEAMAFMHGALHDLRDAWHAVSRGDSDQAVLEILTKSIKNFASAFSLTTAVHCRACIKELRWPEDVDPQDPHLGVVSTLCRSQDGPPPPKEFPPVDTVSDNSDFLVLLRQPHEQTFFSNNLLKARGYKNSHWTSEVHKRKEYPYISTVVWPIRKEIISQTDRTDRYYDCLGFLCIDSKARNVFRKRFDKEVGAGYADALYMFWRCWIASKSSQKEVDGQTCITDTPTNQEQEQ